LSVAWKKVGQSSDFETTCGTYKVFANGFYGAYEPVIKKTDGSWRLLTEEEFTLSRAKSFCEEHHFVLRRSSDASS
jgi:hypothetical protein